MTGLVPNVWAAIIVPIPFATLALALRLRARQITNMGWGYDDGLSVAAWILAIAYSTDLIIWTTRLKLGQKIGAYDDEQVEYYLEMSRLLLWISEYFYSWSIFFSKMAVLFFYRRLFTFSSIRIPIIAIMAAAAVWVILRTFLTLFRCIPVRASWDVTITDARCVLNVTQFYVWTDSVHCLMDFVILALPIYEVVRMKLPTGQKLATVCLFASGSLVGVASIFQIIAAQTYRPGSRELPYDFALAMVWGSAEIHLAVFASSLPLLRPIFRKKIPGLATGTSDATSRRSIAFQPSPNPTGGGVRSPGMQETQTSGSASMEISMRQEAQPITDAGPNDKTSGLRGSASHEEYVPSMFRSSP